VGWGAVGKFLSGFGSGSGSTACFTLEAQIVLVQELMQRDDINVIPAVHVIRVEPADFA
jgi:hypothetical protein